MRSLKGYSYAINFITFVAGLIMFLGVENLRTVVPDNFQYLIPVVVLTANYILVQLSEDKRVERAENIATNEAFNEFFSSPPNNLGGGNSNAGYRKL